MWYRWKYSGMVTVPILAVLIVVTLFYWESELEFFYTWDCDTIKNYMLDQNVTKDITPHDEITEKQHVKLHVIYQECLDFNSFNESIDHDTFKP